MADAAVGGSSAAGPSNTKSKKDKGSDDESTSCFECNICLELASEPVTTMCGHLFCWPCLYKWMSVGQDRGCPVCKALIDKDKIIPLYGRGKTPSRDPRKSAPSAPPPESVPQRPQGQRTENPNPPPQSHAYPSGGPQYFMGPGFGGVQVGGISFSAGFGPFGLFPSLFAFNFGAQPQRPPPGSLEEQQQAFISRILLMLGTFVILCLLLF
eukprot:tig00001331_g8167.t1